METCHCRCAQRCRQCKRLVLLPSSSTTGGGSLRLLIKDEIKKKNACRVKSKVQQLPESKILHPLSFMESGDCLWLSVANQESSTFLRWLRIDESDEPDQTH